MGPRDVGPEWRRQVSQAQQSEIHTSARSWQMRSHIPTTEFQGSHGRAGPCCMSKEIGEPGVSTGVWGDRGKTFCLGHPVSYTEWQKLGHRGLRR